MKLFIFILLSFSFLNPALVYSFSLKPSQAEMSQIIEWAEQGDADAQFHLGRYYFYGIGVNKNDKTAIDWYEKAADQGHVSAHFALGKFYHNTHPDIAFYWYQKMALEGYSGAQFSLGHILQKKEQYKSATYWYEKAARQGHVTAQKRLSLLYRDGKEGVPKDLKAAEYWFKQANPDKNYDPNDESGYLECQPAFKDSTSTNCQPAF